ncbi:Hint domain-containing protein [Roseinatronobacter sp.]|uniref:Hint domain-containing protein n=1 Tax=Roseinatronobacter sp. TaxID=1945755 RepID=UPI0025E3F296|nr:Hint domain-containing protein [Rhodobaca sp.]
MITLDPSVHQFVARIGSIFKETRPGPFCEASRPNPVDDVLHESGLLAGTLVANQNGWVPAEQIGPGDLVLTFDNGMQPVAANESMTLERADMPRKKAFTMFVPKGALGNRVDMNILPMQEVIVESDRAEALYGDPFVLMPCFLLDGYKGIHTQQFYTDLHLSMLLFENEQIIHTNGGMLALGQMLTRTPCVSQHAHHSNTIYPRLTYSELLYIAEWRPHASDRHAAFAAQSLEDTWLELNTKLES